MRSDSPSGLLVLVKVLAAGVRGAVQPLRDATCQSFPVWSFAPEIVDALVALSDDEIERVSQEWLDHEEANGLDNDAYELSLLLDELREVLSNREDPELELFVLLEEKAL